jgi:hypothetical protein
LNRKVALAVGFLCGEALEAALPILKQAGIPVITIGVRTNSLTDNREKTGWPIYRLAPRADGEAAAVNRIIPALWRESPLPSLMTARFTDASLRKASARPFSNCSLSRSSWMSSVHNWTTRSV